MRSKWNGVTRPGIRFVRACERAAWAGERNDSSVA